MIFKSLAAPRAVRFLESQAALHAGTSRKILNELNAVLSRQSLTELNAVFFRKSLNEINAVIFLRSSNELNAVIFRQVLKLKTNDTLEVLTMSKKMKSATIAELR